MDKTCSTCLYWASSFKPNKFNVADCDRPLCLGAEQGKDEIVMEIEASADDDSNLDARLMTSGNFGCILHKDKK